jgi:hypothetical protein
MSSDRASQMVNQWDQSFQQAKVQTEQTAREAGDVAARSVSQGAFWAFLAMVLGLAVAAWGGWVGTRSLPRYKEPVATPVT